MNRMEKKRKDFFKNIYGEIFLKVENGNSAKMCMKSRIAYIA